MRPKHKPPTTEADSSQLLTIQEWLIMMQLVCNCMFEFADIWCAHPSWHVINARHHQMWQNATKLTCYIMLKYAVTVGAHHITWIQVCSVPLILTTLHKCQQRKHDDQTTNKWCTSQSVTAVCLSDNIRGGHVTEVTAEAGTAPMIWKWLKVWQFVAFRNWWQMLLWSAWCLRWREVHRFVGKLIRDVLCVRIWLNLWFPRRRNLSVTFTVIHVEHVSAKKAHSKRLIAIL